ncbi:MAG: hypothetical protein WCO71_04800 [Pseudomonadota bacterium]
MNNNSQIRVTYVWNIFGWLMSILTLAACSPGGSFTTPFCGPGSVDNAPMAALPAEVWGCYATNMDYTASMFFGQSIIYPMTSEDLEYLDLRMTQGHLTVGLPGRFTMEVNQGGICANPMNPNGHSFINIGKDQGWWSASTMEWASDWSSFQMTSMSFDREKLQQSGLRYSLFPGGNFMTRTGERERSNIRGQALDSAVGMVLIDNHSLPFKDLMAAISLVPRRIRVAFDRVDDSKCQRTQLKYYQMAGDGRLKAVSRADSSLR